MNKEQKKRFNEFCKKEKLNGFQKKLLKLIIQIVMDEKLEALKNPGSKIANYILTGKK